MHSNFMSKTERRAAEKTIRTLQVALTRKRVGGGQYGDSDVDALVAEIDRVAMTLPENQW